MSTKNISKDRTKKRDSNYGFNFNQLLDLFWSNDGELKYILDFHRQVRGGSTKDVKEMVPDAVYEEALSQQRRQHHRQNDWTLKMGSPEVRADFAAYFPFTLATEFRKPIASDAAMSLSKEAISEILANLAMWLERSG